MYITPCAYFGPSRRESDPPTPVHPPYVTSLGLVLSSVVEWELGKS